MDQIDYYQKQFIADARKLFPEHASLADDELMKLPEVQEKVSKNPLAPTYIGRIAENLGLEGAIVDPESFRKLCAGYEANADLSNNPKKLNDKAFDVVNGEIQFPTDPKDDRRVGLEILFTTTKERSVISSQAAILDPELYKKMMTIKSRALAMVVKEMEKDAIVRITENGITKEQRGAGIIAVQNSHGENRGPKGGLPEPFDHDHLIVMNTAIDKDGNYYSLDNSLIAKRKAYYNQLFCSLVTEMDREELGFETEAVYVKADQVEKNPHKKETERGVLTHTIKIPDKLKKLVETFSQRSKEIQAEANEGVAKYLEENGSIVDDGPELRGDTDSIDAKALAQLKTKNGKTEMSLSELQKLWREVGKEHGVTADDLKSLQTFADTNKNRQGLIDALANENKSMEVFERELIESFHDYSKQAATREEAAVGFFVRKLITYTNRIDAEKLAEEIFDRHFTGCLTHEADKHYERLLDKKLSLDEQEDAQLKYKKDLLFMDKVLVENEKRMIAAWESRRFAKDFLLADSDVRKLIRSFNDGIIEDTLKKFEKTKARLTPEYLATLDEKKQAKAIRDFEDLTAKVDAINELKHLEEQIKKDIPQDEKMKALERITFLRQDEKSALPKLSHEQVNAIVNATTKEGALAIIEGLPGTGKSFASKVIKEAYQQKGFNIIAVGTSALNTENLRQSIDTNESANIAKLLTDLDSGKRKLTANDVIIADEMGMCDLRMWIRLSDHINELPEGQRPKLIAMGQTEQLTPVGVGQGFTTLSRKNYNTSKLTIVNRQEENWQRQMTQDLSDKKGDIAIKRYCDEGKVFYKAKDIDGAISNAVQEYFDTQYKESRVVITDTNEVADKLNIAIREKIKSELKEKPVEVSVETVDFGKKEFMKGDKVMFLGTGTTSFDKFGNVIKNHKQRKNTVFGLKNGEQAEVIAVDPENNKMTIKTSDGAERTIATDQKLDMSHAYAYSIHKSQGASLDYVGVVISKVQNLNPMLVALSRHKKDMGLFLHDGLKGDLNDTARKKLVALPEDIALIKKYVEYQNFEFKNSGTNVEDWSYARAKNFIKKYAVKELFQIESHPMDEYENLLIASTVLEVKKTTFDYKVLDRRVAAMMEKIGNFEAKQEEQQIRLKQSIVINGEASLAMTSGFDSIGNLSNVDSLFEDDKLTDKQKEAQNNKKSLTI